MYTASEIMNDTGVSNVALAFFTAILSALTAIIVGVFKVRQEARETAIVANDAVKEAKQAKENTNNISNGFAGGMVERLDRIIAEQLRQRDKHEETNSALRDHLEWHLHRETSK